MNLFGHIGITLGLFFLFCMFKPILKTIIDSNYLTIGVLLPDLIDKPLGWVIFASTFSTGRMIGHTFLFYLIILCIGLSAYEMRRDIRIMSLATGYFIHLIEDKMWKEPRILYWPLLGWNFPKGSIDSALLGIRRLMEIFENAFSLTLTLANIPEIVGMLIIILLIFKFILKKLKIIADEQSLETYEKPDTVYFALHIYIFMLYVYIILVLYYIIGGTE
jgi:hypothetical protein